MSCSRSKKNLLKYKLHKLFGVAIFIWIACQVEWNQIRTIMYQCDFLLLSLAFCLSIPHLALKSIRWKYLLEIQGYDLSIKQAISYYLSGIYLGMITPGRVGEFSRAIFLKQSGIVKSVGISFASVIVDRLFDLYVLFVFSMLGIVYFAAEQIPVWWGWGGILICIIVPPLLCSKRNIKFLRDIIFRFQNNSNNTSQFSIAGDEFIAGIASLQDYRLFWAGILSILSYALFFMQCVCIALSLSTPVNCLEISLGMAMANIFSLLPITVAGLGTRESVLFFFLGPNGVTLDEVVAYSIGVLVVFYLGGALLGLFAWWLNSLGGESNRGD